ncbi:sensor histidine kinase [Hydrogenoanaerobacterium sp.]|uniref:sensor histidine kinase n=1 Tax=Hydrogenoanaerobacterium sp. TaxID=2953763 RepID=UPI00289AFBF2|nr:sensor histidine kinase [Hydrogenoanaerobacterium sp.]
MRRMKLWISNLSIQRKIIFYVYLVISPILVLISTVLFISNYRTSIRNQIEADINLVKSVEESISVIQSDVTDLSIYLCINSDINQILTSGTPQALNQNRRLWMNNAPMQFVEDIIALKGYIKTIAIYPENGVFPYLRCIDSSAYLPSIEQVRNTDTYQASVANKGEVTWARVSRGDSDIYKANRTDKIVMYREIYDLSKKTPLGYLVFGIDARKYTDLCKNALQQGDEGIVVLSWRGEELTRAGEVDAEILQYVQSTAYTATPYQQRDTYFQYGSYNVFCSQSQKKGVLVCKMVPKSAGNSQLYSIAMLPVLLLIGLLLGLWPLLQFVSNVISKPLGRLCLAMDKFKKGDFEQKVTVTASDEVGAVTECFNQMVEEIKELIDTNYVMALKEKESELVALQAQINPHFLYNTLDSLYWRALHNGNEELAEDILALSQLFRLVLGQGKGIIPVCQERELIARYLQIQKMRFTDRLEYSINIQEDMLDYYIPKLILQPFVENAIIHGLENTSATGRLLVTGCLKGGYLEFSVQDNGIGMTPEQVDGIWNMDDSKRYSSQRIGGYAIKNVKERLELKYQDDYRLHIHSEVGKGTTITIAIPAKGKVVE